MIRAQGHPQIAMATMLIGAITNTILDPILSLVWVGGRERRGRRHRYFPDDFGRVGAVLFHNRKKPAAPLNLRRAHKISWPVVGQIVSIGFAPPFAMQLAASLQNLILNQSLAEYGGDLAISAMGIVFSVNTLFLMPIFGINQGSQPIIGFNYGAKQFGRVKETLFFTQL